MTDDTKFQNICFCCLTEEGQLKNMAEEAFVANQIKVQIVEGYATISGISPNDEAIKNICAACELKLKQSYEFRELCRLSYRTLRSQAADGGCYVDVKRELESDNENHSTDQAFSQVYVTDEGVLEDRATLKYRHGFKRRKDREKSSAKRLKLRKLHHQPSSEQDVADMASHFVCYHCESNLPTYNEFLRHRATVHKSGNKFQSHKRVCHLCGEAVKNFVEHIGDHHKDYRPNRCSYCDKGRYQTPLELRGHLYSHLTCEATHQCMACDEMFKNEVQLRTHIGSGHHKSDAYLCPYCGLEFESIVSLVNDHFQRVHEPAKKLFPCFNCKKVYMMGKYYADHDCKRGRTKDAKITAGPECERCMVQFSCRDELECHKIRGCAADPEAHKCEECGKSFGSRKKLVRHIRTHDPAKRQFICDECGHAAMSAGQLKLHKFMHVTDRPFQCQLCPATFKLEQHLKGHQKVHEEKPFECYVCEKKFRTYPNIRQHMAVHSDSSVLRRFACEICGKTSTSNTTLKNHLKTHTNEQNVKCGLCPKTFGDNSQLKNHHRKVHEGMFYECKFCGKPYKEKVKFRNHLYVHRGFKPFNCPVCASQHVEKYIFVKHLRNQHNITFDEKKHGYRETENIKALIEECLRRPTDSKVSPITYSGVRIVEQDGGDKKQVNHDRQMENASLYGAEQSTEPNVLVPVHFLLPNHQQRSDDSTGYHLQSN